MVIDLFFSCLYFVHEIYFSLRWIRKKKNYSGSYLSFFKHIISNISWFQPIQCKGLLLFFVIYSSQWRVLVLDCLTDKRSNFDFGQRKMLFLTILWHFIDIDRLIKSSNACWFQPWSLAYKVSLWHLLHTHTNGQIYTENWCSVKPQQLEVDHRRQLAGSNRWNMLFCGTSGGNPIVI